MIDGFRQPVAWPTYRLIPVEKFVLVHPHVALFRDLFEVIEVELPHETLETRVAEVLGEHVAFEPLRVLDLSINERRIEVESRGGGRRRHHGSRG